MINLDEFKLTGYAAFFQKLPNTRLEHNSGGVGDDVLRGLQNLDNLTEGTGRDTFVIEYLDRQWVDVIKDFSAAQNDKIQFKGFPAGDSARRLAGSAGIISLGGTNVVEIQVNGSADETLANSIRTTSTLYEFVD